MSKKPCCKRARKDERVRDLIDREQAKKYDFDSEHTVACLILQGIEYTTPFLGVPRDGVDPESAEVDHNDFVFLSPADLMKIGLRAMSFSNDVSDDLRRLAERPREVRPHV